MQTRADTNRQSIGQEQAAYDIATGQQGQEGLWALVHSAPRPFND